MGKKITVLSIGHSYVVAMNRSILREVAEDPDFEVIVGSPNVFKGSLRTIKMEAEPINSKIKLIGIDAYWTQKMHLFFYNPWQLKNIFKKDIDVAHFWEEPYLLSGFQLTNMSKRMKIPCFFRTAQSLIKNYIFPFNKFEAQSVSASETFVAGGHLVFEAMNKKKWNISGQVITLAVDSKAFQPFDEKHKNDAKQKLKIQGPVIGYLGRLSEEKGLDLIMECLEKLKKQKWTFLFMGSGPYKEKILTWAQSQGLSDRIKIVLLKHDEVPQYLPMCDLLLCPSQTRSFWKEQFGRMIVEAFASGVPIIASDSGEIPRVVGEAGIILPESDVSAWKEKIESYLNNPESFKIYSEKGLQRVHQYSAKNIAKQYKDLYRSLAR